MMKLKELASVADILERELQPTIKEWLRRVNLIPELTDIPLSDADRTGHLPKLYFDLISRLRLAKDAHPPIEFRFSGNKRRPRDSPRVPRDGAGLYSNLPYLNAHFVVDLIVHFPAS